MDGWAQGKVPKSARPKALTRAKRMGMMDNVLRGRIRRDTQVAEGSALEMR